MAVPRTAKPAGAPYRSDLIMNPALAALDDELKRLEETFPADLPPPPSPAPSSAASRPSTPPPLSSYRHVPAVSFGRPKSAPRPARRQDPDDLHSSSVAFYDANLDLTSRFQRAPAASLGTAPTRSSSLENRKAEANGGRTAPPRPPLSPYDPSRYASEGWAAALDRLKKRVRTPTSFASPGRDGHPSSSRPASADPSLDVIFTAVEPRAGRGVVAWHRDSSSPSGSLQETRPADAAPLDLAPLPSLDAVLPRHPAWSFGAGQGPVERAGAEGSLGDAGGAGARPSLHPNYDLVKPHLGSAPLFAGYSARDPPSAEASLQDERETPAPNHYDPSTAWLRAVAKHAPAAAFPLAAGDRAISDSFELEGGRLELELGAAQEAVRARPPAWRFGSAAGPEEEAMLDRAREEAERDRRGAEAVLPLDVRLDLVKKRPPGVPVFDLFTEREHEVDREKRLRDKVMWRAEPLRYSIVYDQVEAREPSAVIPRAGARYGDGEAPEPFEPKLPYDVEGGLEALRTRREPFVDFGKQRGRDEDREPSPRALHRPLPDPDADLVLRRRPLMLVDMEKGADASDVAATDPAEARRGPGMYPAADRYKAIGTEAFAADFAHAVGRPDPLEPQKEGNVLELSPDDRVLRPRPPAAYIAPEAPMGRFPPPHGNDLPDAYDYDLSVIRARTTGAPDFSVMLPRDDPNVKPPAISELADVPLHVLALWPKGPARPAGIDMSKVSGRPDPKALAPSTLSDIDPERGLAFLRPARHTAGPDFELGGPRGIQLDGRDAREVELSAWREYEPSLDMVRPRMQTSLAFESYTTRPEPGINGRGGDEDFRSYEIQPGERLIFRRAPMVVIAEESERRAVPELKVHHRASPEGGAPRTVQVPEPFSRGERRFAMTEAKPGATGWMDPAPLARMDAALALTRPTAPRAAFALAEEDGHAASVWQERARVARELPPVKVPPGLHAKRRTAPMGTVSDYAQNIMLEQRVEWRTMRDAAEAHQ